MASSGPIRHLRAPKLGFVPRQSDGTGVPAVLTRIVGREADTASLLRTLHAGETRLYTLTGTGGVGKTRLAIEVASRAAEAFAHGSSVVALDSVRDPSLVPAAVGFALGIQEAGSRPVDELVVAALRQRHMLLVLDNLEHVVDVAAPWLSNLLASCPKVTVLATSRVPLRIGGEQRYQVRPLRVPNDTLPVPDSEAVQLFVLRARESLPEFALSEANAGEIAAICRSLDGVPLAIELAASRVNVLSPRELLARLHDRFAVLRSDRRDAPARHHTMRDAIAWSYDLLSPEQQWSFRRLAGFAGGFTLDAAQAVAMPADSTRDEATRRLAELVDHSLVRDMRTRPDETRFAMLETIREFGLERLEAHDETSAARDAHAAWCLALARTADPTLGGTEQVAWLDRLEREFGNLREAIAWLTERQRIEEALDLVGSLWYFLWIRGHYSEGRHLYESLLARPAGARRTAARAKALYGLGLVAQRLVEANRAVEALEESISIFRALGEREYLAWALICLASAFLATDRIDDADALCAEARQIASEVGFANGLNGASCIVGITSLRRGDRDTGLRLLGEIIDRCRTAGEPWGLLLGLVNRGMFARQEGRIADAARDLGEALQLVRVLEDKRDLPQVLVGLAGIARLRGDDAETRAMLEEAVGVARDTGDLVNASGALATLGIVELEAGDPTRAASLLREALDEYLTLGSTIGGAILLDAFADIAIATGESGRAARWIGAVDSVLAQSGTSRREEFPGQHQARVDAITGAIGDDAYRQAWRAGERLTIDEMIAEARAYEPAAASSGIVEGPAAGLSPRELEVLRLMADGLTNQEIADALFLSRRTATSHTSNILGKLGVTSRTAAVAFAIRNGLA